MFNLNNFENRSLLKPVLGAWPLLLNSQLFMNRRNQTEIAILF